MSKGLDAILGRIKEQASPTLVERYLALLAELPDDVEKAQRALAVANILLGQRPSQALQIAQMVYETGHEQMSALDIIIGILEQKGRHQEAERFRAKKRRLEPRSSGVAKAANDWDINQLFGQPKLARPTFALADLAEEPQRVVAEQQEVDDQKQRAPEVPNVSLGAAVALFDHYWGQGFVAEARDILVQTAPVAGHEAWWQARHALVENAAAFELRPKVVAAAVPIFVSKPNEDSSPAAEELLEKKSSDTPILAATPARSADLTPMLQLVDDVDLTPALLPPPAEASMPQLETHAQSGSQPEWKALYDELLRTAARRRLPSASTARLDLFKESLASRDVPERFLKILSSVSSEMMTERGRLLLWDLLIHWWGEACDERLFVLLRLLGLHQLQPQWFGLYLDCMLATGRLSQIAAVVERTLRLERTLPKLEWARVAMQRLPQALDGQGLRSFEWHEDEGVTALLDKLATRPQPRLRAVVLATLPDIKS